MKNRLLAGLVVSLGILYSLGVQAADGYPAKPLRFIVPLGPGSAADTNTRSLADRLQKLTGQPVIVENKPGADLIVGTTTALNEPADGYTVLLISPSTMLINPLLIADLPYKPEQIKPILHLTSNVGVFVVGADSKFNSLGDMLKAAGIRPGAVSMGLYGNSYRLGAQVLARAAGVQFNDIPYKGFSPTVNDVIGGMTQAALVDLSGALPLIEAGKLKALAVTSDERVPAAPDVPTVKESGIADYNMYIFVGYGVRADTPQPVFNKLEALLQEVVAQPDFQSGLKQQAGLISVGTPGKPFADLIASDFKRYQAVVEASKAGK